MIFGRLILQFFLKLQAFYLTAIVSIIQHRQNELTVAELEKIIERVVYKVLHYEKRKVPEDVERYLKNYYSIKKNRDFLINQLKSNDFKRIDTSNLPF